MRFPNIIPTLLLTALLLCGLSQQTPVESLEPRQFTTDSTYLVAGLSAIDFILQVILTLFNNWDKSLSLKSALGSNFNATQTLFEDVLPRAQNILAIANEPSQNSVISAQSDVVTDFQSLFSTLALKASTLDYLAKLYLSNTWAALRVIVMKLADILVKTINRPEVTQNRDKLDGVFSQADAVFKVRSGNGRD